jgi:class 3 adenylate cyclase
VLRSSRKHRAETAVVMMTAHGSEKIAVEAMQQGAEDYVPKPFENEELRLVVSRALERTQLQRKDLKVHAAPDGTVTLMFSDMENYTGLLERLGDRAAFELVQEHNTIVRQQTQSHGGHEVELRGDGFLLAFATASKAVQCATALQRAFRARNESDREPIRIRIGLHTGEAISDADKFFGKTVVQAFRIADLAQGGEILVSLITKELVEHKGGVAFDEGRELELKGLAGTHRVYRVV